LEKHLNQGKIPMNLVYIHGHAASMKCFSFIRKHLGHSKEIFLEYDSNDGFAGNCAAMLERLKNVDEVFFIAHSVGGIYALHLAHSLENKVLGAVTLSTPYGGSTEAGFLQFFSAFHPILRDVHPYSRPISDGNSLPILHPWTAVVTTAGHYPFTIEPNDGVVTLKSMRHRKDLQVIELPLNHNQVLLSERTVEIIRDAIGRAKPGFHKKISVRLSPGNCAW
jgi:pimeloyl-ACP methyl ester carboxylesterase